ncbi:hypothetical protein CLV58_1633 [Spirosoma oryzae]|uniref:Uncharacterized protein n=1 Tax=Spirosoma oryzae TaxID=1469603 RepID=A0A2T0RFP9_9BACT|nr:hypothetical protein [Spirosoma oryzae]PRY19962.1 hypothetical protein CLV58_1633 [Spirosoma oryzae]
MTNTIKLVATDSTGCYHQRRWKMHSIDASFSVINMLVNKGWQFQHITLIDFQGHFVDLPVEAFDGQPMSWHLDQLQQQWQAILGG